MIALEVFINGEKRLTVGGEEYSFLSALLGLMRLPLAPPGDMVVTLTSSGITSDQLRAALWPNLLLAVGDRVEIRVVDVETADAPESVQPLEKEIEEEDSSEG